LVLRSIGVLRCIERPSDVVILVELLDLLQELRILERVLNLTNSRSAWSVTLRTAFCRWVQSVTVQVIVIEATDAFWTVV
jgi:hypothetical protein